MLPESGSTISVHTEVGGGGGGMTSAVITEAPPVGASSCRGTGAPHRPQNFQLPWFALPHWTQYLSQIRIGNGAVRRRCLLPKIFYKWTFHSDGPAGPKYTVATWVLLRGTTFESGSKEFLEGILGHCTLPHSLGLDGLELHFPYRSRLLIDGKFVTFFGFGFYQRGKVWFGVVLRAGVMSVCVLFIVGVWPWV